MLSLILIAFLDTGRGIFAQIRIGQYGKPFKIYKIRTIGLHSKKISYYGKFLRKSKFDELPQLLNIFFGKMSFVGFRPDIPGYYDMLSGESRKILELKPGLFSRAAYKYFNEEYILSQQEHPQKYNDDIIFPDKIKMNLHYYYTRSFLEDLKIMATFLLLKKIKFKPHIFIVLNFFF